MIVPRKGVIELMRMLDGGDTPLRVQIGSNNIRAHVGDFIFTSKLVDGRFPDYRRVLPKNPDKHLDAGCGYSQSRPLPARRFFLTKNSRRAPLRQ
ncbi:DNA polymerase III subunit beta [Klebsiella michiganensis]|uniref:Beta sliding clamp n=1 Tax=Klebsiella michiganensis TaxID=1134687 RepID=A0A7H4PEX1_9ENTR|nr:DNA polymerase III subunit beta [Klebsiella michiganensis]